MHLLAANSQFVNAIFFLYKWWPFRGEIVAALNAEVWLSAFELGGIRDTWSFLEVVIFGAVVIFKQLILEFFEFRLMNESLVDALACWKAIEVLRVLLVLVLVTVNAFHLLQVYDVFDLLGGWLVMGDEFARLDLAGALKLGVLCGVVAWDMVILIMAEYLHLSSLGGSAPIRSILLAVLLHD